MRDKDSLDTERKKLSLNVEKAAKVIEKLQETEKNLTTRLVRWYNDICSTAAHQLIEFLIVGSVGERARAT